MVGYSHKLSINSGHFKIFFSCWTTITR